jgi:hypothetical protein
MEANKGASHWALIILAIANNQMEGWEGHKPVYFLTAHQLRTFPVQPVQFHLEVQVFLEKYKFLLYLTFKVLAVIPPVHFLLTNFVMFISSQMVEFSFSTSSNPQTIAACFWSIKCN